MVLMAIIGELGSGKTLSLTYMAFRNWLKGKEIFSNYRLNFPHVRVKSIKQIDKMREGFFAGDELWLWLDSRASRKKVNIVVSSILAKSRKRGIHIAYTTQSFRQIDIRIRNITDFFGIPKLSPDEKYCTFHMVSNPGYERIRSFRFPTHPFFNLYDTSEEIDPDLEIGEEED